MKKYIEISTLNKIKNFILDKLEDAVHGNFQSKESVEYYLKKYDIKNYTINKDLTVDVIGDVILGNQDLYRIKVKFNFVSGDFSCQYNNLKSLKGCPETVGGSFTCDYNQLTTLEYGPKKVMSTYVCSENKLISLKGSPNEIYDGFWCINNQLTSLKDCPRIIKDVFSIGNNKIENFDFHPDEVRGPFYYDNNPFEKLLEGSTLTEMKASYLHRKFSSEIEPIKQKEIRKKL